MKSSKRKTIMKENQTGAKFNLVGSGTDNTNNKYSAVRGSRSGGRNDNKLKQFKNYERSQI